MTAYRDRERPCDHTHHLLVLTLEPLPLEHSLSVIPLRERFVPRAHALPLRCAHRTSSAHVSLSARAMHALVELRRHVHAPSRLPRASCKTCRMVVEYVCTAHFVSPRAFSTPCQRLYFRLLCRPHRCLLPQPSLTQPPSHTVACEQPAPRAVLHSTLQDLQNTPA